MWRISRSASDGRFDSATSLVPSRQYSSRNPSSTPSSPVDSQVTKPIASYSAFKLSQPTEASQEEHHYHLANQRQTGSYLSSRSPAAPKSISSRLRLPHYLNKVVPLLGPSFPSQTHLASDDTSSLASSDTLASGTANRLSCKVCGATFTGKYGRGNRGRHMRQYHTQAAMTSFKCPVEGCPKTFARQDARLKHQRTHHSELHPNSSASPINLGEVPVSISTALSNIRTKLDDEAYAQLCDMFLYLFPRIVQYLRDTGSNTYDVYMDVLKEIVLVVDEIESDSIDSINQVMVDPVLLSHPPHHSGAASANKGKGSVTTLGPNSMSRMDSNHPSRGQKLTHGQKHGSYKVAKGHQNESPPSRLVDCPDHKHHVMDPESRTSPCHGCRVKNMAQVRHHLRRINHQGRPGTWKCPFCKKDFNHERTMDEHIEAKSCQTQVQSRGDIVKPWAMLYLTRHPDAQRIPSPYCDEREWLSQSMWAECRASLQDTPTPMQDTTTFVPDTAAPFSGFIENATRGQDHEMVHSNNTPAESSQAAEHFATQLVNSMFSSMSNNHSTALTSNSTVGFNGNHQLGQNPPLYYTATQHGLLVQNLARRLVSIAQSLVSQAPGTMHVEMGQISPIATEAETVVNNTPIHNQFQLPHVQPQLQDDSNSAVNLPAPLFLGSSNIETSDFWSEQHETTQNESFRTQHSNQYSTPTLSTHSSQTDVPTDSYLTQPSPITNPSSAYGMTDRMLHSASNSPHHYRRGSGNSDVSDCPIPPRMQPDPQGLLGTNSQFEDAPSIEPERPEPFEFAEFIDPRILTMLNAETDMSQL